MKVLIILILNLSIFVSEARALDYTINKAHFLSTSIIESLRFEEHFSKFELISLSQSSLFHLNQLYDFAYSSSDLQKYVLLKSGIVTQEKEYGIFYHEEHYNALVTHIKVKGVSYLLIAKGFKQDELKILLAPFMKKEAFGLINIIIPSAYAQEELCLPQVHKLPTSGLDKSYHQLNESFIRSQITKCAIDSLKSMKSSLESTYGFYKDLLTDPKKVWNETLRSFESLKVIILNLNNEFKKLLQTISNLSTEEQMNIVCGLTGELIVIAAGSLLLGPQNLMKEVPRLLLKIKTVTASLQKVEYLEKIGIKLSSQKIIIREIVSCAK